MAICSFNSGGCSKKPIEETVNHMYTKDNSVWMKGLGGLAAEEQTLNAATAGSKAFELFMLSQIPLTLT